MSDKLDTPTRVHRKGTLQRRESIIQGHWPARQERDVSSTSLTSALTPTV